MPQCITRTCEGWNKKKKKIRKLYSSIEVGLFSRLTCNTRPLSFTVIVYPTLPGCVCPHNPIIPDKIFHYLEYFQCCPGQSSFGPFFFFFFFSLQQQSVLLSIGSIIHLQGERLHWGRFSLLGQMAGHSMKLWPLLSARCDCSDAYGPSLYIVQTLSRVKEGSSLTMLLENEYD